MQEFTIYNNLKKKKITLRRLQICRKASNSATMTPSIYIVCKCSQI